MAITQLKNKYVPSDHAFYRNHYHHILWAIIAIILILLLSICLVLYQIYERPLPQFAAINPSEQQMALPPYNEPNLLSDTILRWASKAAITAYTFRFYDYDNELKIIRPYFTEAGWVQYLSSVSGLLSTIVEKKLNTNSVVSGPPVISNQGPLPGVDYAWRVQIPFLVTYETDTVVSSDFLVILTIVRVPTSINPQGIGIDQFVMVSR